MYRKYLVKKLNDPHEKHRDCRYFVLDLDHDPLAAHALRAYAAACEDDRPALAADLLAWADHIKERLAEQRA